MALFWSPYVALGGKKSRGVRGKVRPLNRPALRATWRFIAKLLGILHFLPGLQAETGPVFLMCVRTCNLLKTYVRIGL